MKLSLNESTERIGNLQPGKRIHQLFEEQAALRPDAIAITCGSERLTYRELNERANQLACWLRRQGVGPTAPVALCLERSLEMVVAIVGVLKSGAAYLPVDLAYPRERLEFMLQDAQAKILLTQQRLLSSLPKHACQILCLDSDWEKIAPESLANYESGGCDADVAYILFTSGSTGKPKGVLVTHRNVVRLFSSTEHWFGFGAADVWSLFHSYAFDLSVWEMWGALFYGGRVVVVPYLTSRAPEAFYELLSGEGVTMLTQTPSAFRQLMWAEVSAKSRLPLKLRSIVFAGEALELQSLRPWFELHGDEQPEIINMYGITETTVHVTYRRIRVADLEQGLGSVIGVPIPDLQLYLLDENLKAAPVGAVGEIFVGGAGVANGYLNRPELTCQRFLADPFSSDPAARLYRSGDLARMTAEGELEFLGRADRQVKIRGFRVELGEIEAALNQHPAVQQSAVIASESAGPDKRLIAYIVPRQANPSVTELREAVAQKLPEYMTPSAFVFLAALPLTPNGKLDARALPSPDHARPAMETGFAAPEPGVEETLARIWSEVLEIAPIGRNDNLFELGGDSIRCIQILARARQNSLRLTLADLFEERTIAKLAARLKTSVAEISDSARTEPFALLSPEDRRRLPEGLEDAYPALMLQRGMFFHNDLKPASAVFHDILSFRIEFPFLQPKLEQALAQMARRHPSLRTSFDMKNFSEPLQLVHRCVLIPLAVEDLRLLDARRQEEALDAWIAAEKHRPIERARAPLLSVAVHLYRAEVFQLIVSFHHAVLDGWSLAAMVTELLQDYGALIKGTGRQIEAPRIAYREYVALERKAIASEACRQFWAKKLQDPTLHKLPRWPESLRAGGTEQRRGPQIQIPGALFEALKKLARRSGTPVKTVLHAAHLRVMNLLGGSPDVISGFVTNGRPEQLDGERIIGLSLNTVPLRLQLEGGTWLDLIRQTFEAEREIIPFRRLPLPEIQALAGGRTLFETAFDFVHFHVYRNLQAHQDMGFSEGRYFDANDFTFLTTFMLDVNATQLQMRCDYDPEELSLRQIEQASGYYVKTLETMAAEPTSRYETFSPLPAGQRAQLLAGGARADYSPSQCVHQQVEAQAALTPEAPAVECEGAVLTYRQLNEQANQLAYALRSMGVSRGTPVGMCLRRSLGWVVGILGILKAGGAYVPLDPDQPSERLTCMLQDCKAPLILTTQAHALSKGLSTLGVKILCFDRDQDFIAGQSRANPAPSSGPDDLIYIIYTSGSTGRPKGAAVYHRGFANLLHWFVSEFKISAADRVLLVSAPGFDLTQKNLFAPLMRGGRLHLLPSGSYDPARILPLIEQARITLINCTPSGFYPLIESGDPDAFRKIQSLRCVFLGGEPIAKSRLRPWLENPCCRAEIANTYGPTECSDISGFHRVTRANFDQFDFIPLGRPISNVRLAVVDSRLGLCPIGVPGELLIGGECVGAGYLNDPGLTASRFIESPFPELPSGRWYKSGDLARVHPDGNLEYLGRLDHQVKIRGFRVELGEIEAVLRQHPNVREIVVVAQEEGANEKRLAAYFSAKTQPAPEIGELRDLVKKVLPDYMVPALFVKLEALPLSSNGKVDRKALPVARPDQAGREENFVAPQTPAEKVLAQIWCEVLGLKRVGVNDNFFELGGHSLMAMQVISRAPGGGLGNLTLADLFDTPTIGELAKEAGEAENSADRTPVLAPLGRKARRR